MDTLLEMFFLPPMAFARCGSSPTPAEAFQWAERALLQDSPTTVIEPSISLRVETDGAVTPYRHEEIVLRDGDDGPIRPVAPFFELWGKFQSSQNGQSYEVPLTSALLTTLGASLRDLRYEILAANRKVERRTGNPACGFVAREVVQGNDHAARELKAFSPHTAGQEPLVYQDKPIPLGFFQVLRPIVQETEIELVQKTKIERKIVDHDILRVRFTPPKGLVYGPPGATAGPTQAVPPGTYEPPATLFGRIHEIVPPERRILNGNTEWSRYIMMNGSYEDPAPQDGYDGATVGNHQSWGCVDDSSDSIIEARIVVDGRMYRAIARVFVGPPDFAPDKRPVYSIADDVADRELGRSCDVSKDFDATAAEVLDLFHRAFDAVSLFNLDAERARALQENMVRLARHGQPEGTDEPKARGASMTAKDVPYVDKIGVLAPQEPARFTDATRNDPLPYTEVATFAHGPLKNKAVLLDFLARQQELVKKLIRPAYPRLKDWSEVPAQDPNPDFRDPRVFRDQLHDMRMPPYMRDANLQPLSLSHRQYHQLMDFVERLATEGVPAGKDGAPRDGDGDAEEDFRHRIFARNLTARAAQAARVVTGNPVTTRFETGVGNCFPGLEFDVRVLDRRFFPGLVFQFVQQPRAEYELPNAIKNQHGAHLLYADWFLDPMLPESSPEPWVQDLIMKYKLSPGGSWMGGRWYLDWIEQGNKRLSTKDASGNYLDGYLVWRMVRCLEPGKELKIGIINRDDPSKHDEFTGYRRQYVNQAGVFDEAFRAGELTHSMCNPWSHDFRDCGCHYWPTNHPDIAIRRSAEALPDGRPSDPMASSVYVNWNRLRGPEKELPAFDTIPKNRPYELDHYQSNTLWEKLPFVLEGREIGSRYEPPRPMDHQPYSDLQELVSQLETKLGPMELSLAMQYLYALFSLRDPDEVDPPWSTLRDDLKAIRQFVLMVAVGEMQHLRWVNQMLWELDRAGHYPKGRSYKPVVDWIDDLPVVDASGNPFKIQLRRLIPSALDDFIYIERPSGKLTAAYGRCVATLKDRPELKNVYELAQRIDGEGIDHYASFCNTQRILAGYGDNSGDYPYLRRITVGTNNDALNAVALFDTVRSRIAEAYAAEAVARPDFPVVQAKIKDARDMMLKLQAAAEALAKQGYGVPFEKGKRPLLP